ncbi:MAG TPA: carbamoyl-phosphate-synthetase, partial [Clostridiaceae bacterium]|nr:carbamoyl-phosphate-synthetase [Clostridiaceae bacterium]
MNDNLLGKKILILGGSSEGIETVRNANDMGMKTIVVDPYPDAPAKKIAWKAYDIDALDIEALVKLGEKEQIDGVFVGLSERLLKVYSRVCTRLNLPCYCTLEQIAIFGDKIAFKQKCREYGIPVINDYTLGDNMPYPVLVKPVDSSGSKGISVCNDEEELLLAVERAKSFSPTGRYLIEDFLEGEQLTA